jgi:GTPase SAR1 family protein
VIIGDGACGKTSLLSVFTLGYFPTVSQSTRPLPKPLLTAPTALCESDLATRIYTPPPALTTIFRYRLSSRIMLQTVGWMGKACSWHSGILRDRKITKDYDL